MLIGSCSRSYSYRIGGFLRSIKQSTKKGSVSADLLEAELERAAERSNAKSKKRLPNSGKGVIDLLVKVLIRNYFFQMCISWTWKLLFVLRSFFCSVVVLTTQRYHWLAATVLLIRLIYIEDI